jgi:hypothetical protein
MEVIRRPAARAGQQLTGRRVVGEPHHDGADVAPDVQHRGWAGGDDRLTPMRCVVMVVGVTHVPTLYPL